MINPYRFVFIGECMVELAPAGEPNQFNQSFAGDTFNTAWYLKRVAPKTGVRFVSCIGSDAISDQMRTMMLDAGIDVDHIRRCPDRSVGLYLISLMNGERSFSYWRDQSAARLLADDFDALNAALLGADLIYFSGITLGILSSEKRDVLFQAIRDARARGSQIAFDPNLRPRLWPNTETMCSAIMQAAALSDIVLPSHDDEAEHFGDASTTATLDRYLGAGAGCVIVKDGPGDIVFSQDGMRGRVVIPEITQVVDSTAAGDSFNAAFFAGIMAGDQIIDVIAQAARVSGQVIGKKGALVALDFDILKLLMLRHQHAQSETQ